jgi:hypothetical protein
MKNGLEQQRERGGYERGRQSIAAPATDKNSARARDASDVEPKPVAARTDVGYARRWPKPQIASAEKCATGRSASASTATARAVGEHRDGWGNRYATTRRHEPIAGIRK